MTLSDHRLFQTRKNSFLGEIHNYVTLEGKKELQGGITTSTEGISSGCLLTDHTCPLFCSYMLQNFQRHFSLFPHQNSGNLFLLHRHRTMVVVTGIWWKCWALSVAQRKEKCWSTKIIRTLIKKTHLHSKCFAGRDHSDWTWQIRLDEEINSVMRLLLSQHV